MCVFVLFRVDSQIFSRIKILRLGTSNFEFNFFVRPLIHILAGDVCKDKNYEHC